MLHISTLSVSNMVFSVLFCICIVSNPSLSVAAFEVVVSFLVSTVSSISFTTVVIMQDCRSMLESSMLVCNSVRQMVRVGLFFGFAFIRVAFLV